MFLREAIKRLFGEPFAWVWLLLEPILTVTLLAFMLTAVRLREVGGIETAVWIMVGMLGFNFFRKTFVRSLLAIRDNRKLFVFRQVKPFDPVIVRTFLEGFLNIVVSVLVLMGAALIGLEVIPDDPLMSLEAAFGIWLVGLGFGLMGSVAMELMPGIGKTMRLSVFPLFLFSGLIFPISAIPDPYREWALLNPLAHGLEAIRLGFSSQYAVIPELDVAYLYLVALSLVFLGLALQVRFALRILER